MGNIKEVRDKVIKNCNEVNYDSDHLWMPQWSEKGKEKKNEISLELLTRVVTTKKKKKKCNSV